MVTWSGSRFKYVYNWYEDQFKHKHGSDRYYWENLPFYGSLHRFRAGAERAEDQYQNTGKDDYYGDRYASDALNSVIGSFSAPLPGMKIPTMAKTLTKMYGAEVMLDASKHRAAAARSYERSARMWSDYQRHKKYNDW